MKRILTLLAVFVATAGCTIEEAEYFEPTDHGFRMFLHTNRYLSNEASVAARVMLFSAYYSAPEEERETLHDRYFYSSRIVSSGDEWRIIDSGRELVIRTDGQPLSTAGATWKYAYSFRNYSGDGLPTIVCRTSQTGYDLHLPDGGGELSFTAAYYSQPQNDGTAHYWCELQFDGRGECSVSNAYACEFEKVAYEIVEPLVYESNHEQRFERGIMQLTARTADGPLEARAEYESDRDVWISCGSHEKRYGY